MLFGIVAMAIAMFFAMNIGASGTAAAMGAAYGGGAVRSRFVATVLVGAAAFLGAVLGGEEVAKTIGKGLIPSELLLVEITVIILLSACLTLFVANLLGIPLSTSEVTVGSVVGVGVAYQSLFAGKILFIVLVWIILPFIAFFAAYYLGKLTPGIERRLAEHPRQRIVRRAIRIFLIGAGCYEAFAAGMNNVANAVGPLIGANMIDSASGVLLGGLFVALGAILMGGKVLETNGKKITSISLLQGGIVSTTSGTLVIIASVFGLPVPLTQATTMSIFGIGTADQGIRLWKSDIVKRIVKIWIISPISSLAVSFALVQGFIFGHIYVPVLLVGLIVAIVLYRKFVRASKSDAQAESSVG